MVPNNSVLGVVCTELEFNDRNTILNNLMTRLSETLRKNLSEQQIREVSISFHLFPEERNHEFPQRPTGPGTSSMIQ